MGLFWLEWEILIFSHGWLRCHFSTSNYNFLSLSELLYSILVISLLGIRFTLSISHLMNLFFYLQNKEKQNIFTLVVILMEEIKAALKVPMSMPVLVLSAFFFLLTFICLSSFYYNWNDHHYADWMALSLCRMERTMRMKMAKSDFLTFLLFCVRRSSTLSVI